MIKKGVFLFASLVVLFCNNNYEVKAGEDELPTIDIIEEIDML